MGLKKYCDKIPEDKEVVIICAKEGSSIMVAEKLVEEGINNIHIEKAE